MTESTDLKKREKFYEDYMCMYMPPTNLLNPLVCAY